MWLLYLFIINTVHTAVLEGDTGLLEGGSDSELEFLCFLDTGKQGTGKQDTGKQDLILTQWWRKRTIVGDAALRELLSRDFFHVFCHVNYVSGLLSNEL